MSKRESIARYNLIIKKVRKCPASFEEIIDFLGAESELQGYNFVVSKRTFQRDLEDIASLYNIEIEYDFSRKAYCIESESKPEMNERMLEAFDVFNALNISDRLSDYIHFEKRKPQGTENLNGLLHTITNHCVIKFVYSKFQDAQPTLRTVEPYALKEFKNRWYLLANETNGNVIKCFALDRISELEITRTTFVHPESFNLNEYYKYCFGIISPEPGDKPQEIILSFDPYQGKYIKSLPLHESQQIITDNQEELRIKLTLYPTYDLLMEILSYGPSVKVIEPKELANEVKASLKDAFEKY